MTTGNIGIARRVMRKKLLPHPEAFFPRGYAGGVEDVGTSIAPALLRELGVILPFLAQQQKKARNPVSVDLNREYSGRVMNPGNMDPGILANGGMDPMQYWMTQNPTARFARGTAKAFPPLSDSPDTVPAMLSPHEAVLTPGAADELGRGKIKALNQRNPPKKKGRKVAPQPFMPNAIPGFAGGVSDSGPYGTWIDGKWYTSGWDNPEEGPQVGSSADPELEPTPIPFNEGSPEGQPYGGTIASGATSGNYVPPPQGAGELVGPPGLPSIPYQLPPFPDWMKFIPGGQYALAGRNIFNAASQIGSGVKNLFRDRGGRVDQGPSTTTSATSSPESGGYYDPSYLLSIGYQPGQGIGSLWPQEGFGGARGGPLPGSFAGLGSFGGGNISDFGGRIAWHEAMPQFGGLTLAQVQKQAPWMLPGLANVAKNTTGFGAWAQGGGKVLPSPV